MQRERRKIDDVEREAEPAAPAPPPDRLAWASAVGNQAVQTLARQAAEAAPTTEEEQLPEAEVEEAGPAPEEEEGPAPEEIPEEELPA
jgi:hypothetical protein